MAQSARSSHRRLASVAALLTGALLTAGSGLASAGYVPGDVDLAFTRVASGLSRPVYMANAGDGTHRKFVVEQDGRIRVYADNWAPLGIYLDIRSRVRSPADGGGNEQGLLGLAFHPNFEGNSRFYVNYTEGDGDTVIAEYRQRSSNPNTASTGERRLMHIAQPYDNHNGGQLAFGIDNLLYIGTGDGGSSGDPGNRAQNISTGQLLGKILRINPVESGTRAYTIPSSNPFVGVTGDDHIWSYGLRNPWRFSFDRSLGDIWIGDVGQNRYEEVDWTRASRTTRLNAGRGRNYGWSCFEGRHTFKPCNPSNDTFPVAEYSHSYGCSVTGGYVYRGTRYPDWQGVYFFGDYCSGRIWSLDATGDGNQAEALLRDTGYLISSFGEDERGYLYLVNHSGEVFRLRDTTP